MHVSIDKNKLLLNENCVDIWQFSLIDEISEADTMLLSADEAARANRFYFAKHRRRFLSARVKLRKILAAYLKMHPQDIQFCYEKHGKPFINHPSFIQFNLSHSHELALLAVGQTYPLGIDIEFFSQRPFLGIGQHLFSEDENKDLMHLPRYLQPLGFFNIWAQKEALIKAVGLGLSYPTKSFNVPVLPISEHFLLECADRTQWSIHTFTPALASRAAICYHPQIKQIRYGML